ncbi:KH domain-containing protein HEN4 [Tripterygium wilfordii]|uniref:KH domain-containing protein HEN4 n=1 Tax=Tripterygium wilfordii TaxID=458696 RepID=UPI0018F8108D|nr:KH domain-containing protein HEN4 [Tripterygium wilfordii]XP_038694532.1 KH domain-containing protein HEN4 [Tripterygium wilfordii]XP_038694533.1 KH domain-containing protein HEN4 [Tripterygium wilfordii]XP_038694534.1 KH domain-containing protein HEN4 [Tripterygium wilfordii]XP_038694535.1 KH domain-containing protein HEN4 [Tripterygium wilfordii]
MMAGQRSDYGNSSQSRSDYGESKRTDHGDDNDQHDIDSEETVYRYLCPVRKIGSIIGKGGEIAKLLRSESKSNIRIAENMPGCDERLVTIYSTSKETNLLKDNGDFVAPALDALFMVHDRIVSDGLPATEEFEEVQQITVRMLVPSDQIGCIIGKGGHIIQKMRTETRAQIRILRDEYLPPLALSNDELLQIIGEPSIVRKALYQVASLLHENPSRYNHLLLASSSNMSQSGGMLMTPNTSAPHGNYTGLSSYPDQRDETFAKEFSLRLVCPTGNIGSVIGKGGCIIKQIRQESRAFIKVDSIGAEDECIIFISAKEFSEDQSPTITAAMRLQPRCSEKTERESGDSVLTTRLLVSSSQIGCLIGKGGAIISEMRNVTRAGIRILSEGNLPKGAYEDDEMVQITGGADVANAALLQVALRLKANLFKRDGILAPFSPGLPFTPMSVDASNGLRNGSRDIHLRGRGYSSHSIEHGSRDIPTGDNYESDGDGAHKTQSDVTVVTERW